MSNSTDEFVSAAAPTGGIKFEDQKGKLFVVEPSSVENGVQTAYGTADPVRADVHIITGPGEADDYPDTLIFPKVLAGQLKSQIGRKVVGRLGQGQAKPGQSAPWLLEPATADDLAKAQEWLAARRPALTSAAPPF